MHVAADHANGPRVPSLSPSVIVPFVVQKPWGWGCTRLCAAQLDRMHDPRRSSVEHTPSLDGQHVTPTYTAHQPCLASARTYRRLLSSDSDQVRLHTARPKKHPKIVQSDIQRRPTCTLHDDQLRPFRQVDHILHLSSPVTSHRPAENVTGLSALPTACRYNV